MPGTLKQCSPLTLAVARPTNLHSIWTQRPLFQGQKGKRSGGVIPWGLSGVRYENGLLTRENVYSDRLCGATDKRQVCITDDRGPVYFFTAFFVCVKCVNIM